MDYTKGSAKIKAVLSLGLSLVFVVSFENTRKRISCVSINIKQNALTDERSFV